MLSRFDGAIAPAAQGPVFIPEDARSALFGGARSRRSIDEASGSWRFERYRVDAAFRRRECGERVRPGLLSVLRGVAHELREDLRFVRARGGWAHLARAPRLRGMQVLGQYFGSKGWNPGQRPAGGPATEAYD